ncbi:MAG TPA: PrsW family glutamic-type intramembrane protease [Thermoanaerobaculia bacterium]
MTPGNPFSLALGVFLGLLPVLLFLLSLLYLDSYKLVRLKTILLLLAAGGVAALLSYFANGLVLSREGANVRLLTIFVTPLIEELLKAVPLLLMFRARRVGFLVDAAIVGFAIGAGFALVENLYYFTVVQNATPALWAVRGFGTGIMHGGSTAIFALAVKALEGRRPGDRPVIAIAALFVAYLVHGLYNSFLLTPLQSAFAVTLLFPALVLVVFARSEKAVQSWLGSGFDLDSDLIAAINSGDFAESPAGRYLKSLRQHFDGPVLADMLCFLRLHAELALRAKGLLMMRESGFAVKRDEELAEKLAELNYLRKSIGKTGELAISPIIHSSAEDVWQLQLLETA